MKQRHKLICCEYLKPSQRIQVIDLWNAEYPKQMAFQNPDQFDEYLYNLQRVHHLLLINDDHHISGWAITFEREEDIWFALIIEGNLQGMGYGKRILNHLKEKEPVLNAWVIDHDRDQKQNGQAYQSPLSFYIKNGFETVPEIRLELGNISAVKIRWSNKAIAKPKLSSPQTNKL